MTTIQMEGNKKALQKGKEMQNERLLSRLQQLIAFMNQQVIGQEELVTRLIIAILADGHLLVEGAPGLAKTRAIKVLSTGIESQFHRVQFTPDLLPADLTGTDIYRMETGTFEFQKGPLFHNLVLADEINRAPAKVQSALLEAMAERQITVGKTSYALPRLFLVMATQNPLEQEGTYPLPEAQLDRFLLKVNITYPNGEKEMEILNLIMNEARMASHPLKPTVQLKQEEIFQAREAVLDLFMSENIQQYIVQLLLATRNPGLYGADMADWIEYGASSRAGIGLARAAKALAFIQGSDFVGPDHVQALFHDVMRHRIILSYRAQAEGMTADRCLDELIARVPVP